jgi:hypothetical protein
MTGYTTAVTDLQAGHSGAAENAITSASNQLFQAEKILTQLAGRCIPS